MSSKPTEYISNLIATLQQVNVDEWNNACKVIKSKIDTGKTIFICGNGGSAQTASHYVTDWQKMFYLKHVKPLNCICLSDNVGMLTAYANDIDYNDVFSMSLASYAKKDDLIIVISGSGNSKNIIKALEKAREIGVTSLAILGFDGGLALPKANHSVHIQSFDMQVCEDIHLSFGHFIMKQIC